MKRGATRSATRRLYDRIADHFASTRSHPWPEVVDFLDTAAPAERGLDLGCGNGRHVPALLKACSVVIALDSSRELLERARREHDAPRVAWLQADVLDLGLRADTVDLGVYIATLHHLPTRDERQASLDELKRVLRPGGSALVSCWCVSHEKFDATEGHDRWVPWTLPSGEVVDRFYHIFDLQEFDRELRGSALTVERTYEAAGNCYAVVAA